MPSKNPIGSMSGGVFDFNAVQSAEDVPEPLLEEVRRAFPTVVRLGEIPDRQGNVMVGKPTPKPNWHPHAEAILKHYHGKPIPSASI